MITSDIGETLVDGMEWLPDCQPLRPFGTSSSGQRPRTPMTQAILHKEAAPAVQVAQVPPWPGEVPEEKAGAGHDQGSQVQHLTYIVGCGDAF